MQSAEAKRRLFWICCVFLLFFRAKWAFTPAWSSDEGCYLEHLYHWIGEIPKQSCDVAPNPVAIGAPVLWAVPAFLGKLIALVCGVQVDDVVIPVVALTSMALWGVGFAFLDGALGTLRPRDPMSIRRRSLWALAIAFAVPVLYYGVHRTMMSHTAEFALAMGTLYFLRTRRPALALGCAIFTSITRYNDAPIVLMALAGFLDADPTSVRRPIPKRSLAIGAAIFAGLFGWVALARGYAHYTVLNLLSEYSWDGFVATFIGGDFGLLWTALPWLVTLMLGLVFFRRLSWVGRAASLWLVAEAFLVFGWSGNGSDFGHRYLIGSYAAAIWLGFEFLERGILRGFRAKAFGILTAIQAAFLTGLLIAFKTLPDTGMGAIENGSRGSPVLQHLLQAPWLPKFFKVVLVQQFPAVTIYISCFMSQRPGYSYYAVHGPALLLLTISTIGCLVWVILALSRRFHLLTPERARAT